MTDKLTRPQLDILELALQVESGNPWHKVGARQRAGGSLSRMFDKMKAAGLFDDANCITDEGRRQFLLQAAGQRVDLGYRTVKRMIHHPGPVNDDTCRCITCGQIDEEPYHQEHVCAAATKLALQAMRSAQHLTPPA